MTVDRGYSAVQLSKTCALGCLFVCAALAQSEGGLRAKVATVHYPPLAVSARIQGDVRLEANSGVVTLVSGHPMLAPLAVDNAKTLGSIQGQMKLDMTYHFVIIDTNVYNVPTLITVKRGNALERALLRVFGFKTEIVVHGIRCEDGTAPASEIKIDGAVIEIWVYGRTFCLENDAATLAARR
jgi:hypothetical protein